MGYEIAIELLKNVFINTSFAGSYWIYQLMFLFGSLLIITRNYKDWGALALPVITGWHYSGFAYNQIFFILAGLVFVVDALTLKTIESGLMSIQEGIVTRLRRTNEGVSNVRKLGWSQGKQQGQLYEDRARAQLKRINVEDEMKQIQRDLKEREFPQLKEERKAMERVAKAKKEAQNNLLRKKFEDEERERMKVTRRDE